MEGWKNEIKGILTELLAAVIYIGVLLAAVVIIMR